MKPLAHVLPAACLVLALAACGGSGAESAGPVSTGALGTGPAAGPGRSSGWAQCSTVPSRARTTKSTGSEHRGVRTGLSIGRRKRTDNERG